MSDARIQSLEIQIVKIIEPLEKKIEELSLENASLKVEIIALKDKLNINSSNSGLPTSKEIYRIEKKTREPSDKKAGGQKGHKHNPYKMKQADKIVKVIPAEEHCKCGGNLLLQEQYSTHQKIEIPPIKPFVTEYHLCEKICVSCKRKYKGKLDNYKLLGSNAESIISSLSGFFNNSKREVQEILSQVFNLDISLGLISDSEGRVSVKLEDKYNELLNMARNSSYLHCDETSHNNKGKRSWAWVATNKLVTVFKLASSRGRKVLTDLLPSFTGKVVSDRYAVYNVFDSDKRQICLAHLRRDFKRFAYSSNKDVAKIGRNLLGLINMVFKIYQLYQKGNIEKHRYLHIMCKIQQIMLYYLQDVSGMSESKQAQRVGKNMLKSFDMMWLFIDDAEIELTNNLAERQIKHHVKYRKNSYFTWSERGDRFLERIKSLYASSKLQKLNPLQELQNQLTKNA